MGRHMYHLAMDVMGSTINWALESVPMDLVITCGSSNHQQQGM